MESLSETKWDVLIAGTGLAQSLLALSLSHSGKKVLHLDQNEYYGGSEAALSLQEAEEWKEQVNKDKRAPFHDVKITIPGDQSGEVRLGPSRSYTLSLSPQLLYAQSALLPALVTSRVHEQLEFQAVGSWWIYSDGISTGPIVSEVEHNGHGKQSSKGTLQKIPSGREDIFADNTISQRDKLAIMKFLRHVLREDTEGEDSQTGDPGMNSLADVLSSQFNIQLSLQEPLLALSLSLNGANSTNARYAMNRTRRHLRSIGMFGPGFGSMIIKYGGVAEIAQVGCRAGAVGGGVYVLGRGVDNIEALPGRNLQSEGSDGVDFSIKLSDGEVITTSYAIGGEVDLPTFPTEPPSSDSTAGSTGLARSISLVSSPLLHLFPLTSENGPIPAGAVVVLGGSRPKNTHVLHGFDKDLPEESPIYMFVHSADTGECPNGQCVVYACTKATAESCSDRLADAVERLLRTADEAPLPSLLWSMSYVQKGRASSATKASSFTQDVSGHIMTFSPASLDLAFDDALLDSVRAVWRKIVGVEAHDADFMQFQERADIGDVDN